MKQRVLIATFLVTAVTAGAVWWGFAAQSLSDRRAEELVREYNRAVIAAFRLADPILVEPVTGPQEGKKIAGLIGSKTDMGRTLDAKLLDLKVTGVTRDEAGLQVTTAENWSYVERSIGTGAVQGPASDDTYKMRYFLARLGGHWVVEHITFDAEPVVGRAAAIAELKPGINHGKERPLTAPKPETAK